MRCAYRLEVYYASDNLKELGELEVRVHHAVARLGHFEVFLDSLFGQSAGLA